MVYAALEDPDEALRWLQRGFEEHSMEMSWLKVANVYDELRDEPRFQDLLRRMNFPE